MDFLIFGGLWFWSIFSFISFLVLMTLIFSEREETVWIYGIILGILFFLSGAWDFAWIANNPLLVLRNVGIYIGIGLLWSMKEWYSYVKEQLKYQLQFMEKKLDLQQRKEYISRNAPRVSSNWTRISGWITFWPYFILTWALTDPIKKIAQQFRVIYNGITNMQINQTLKRIDKEGRQ